MSLPSRPAMRLLSARLRCLSKAPSSGSSVLQNIRNSSRYSKPGSRPTASIPAEFPAFTDAAIDAGPEVTHSGRPLNTLDADAAKREYEAARAHHLGRMRFAGIGLLLSVAGLAATLYNLDLDDIEKAGKKNKVLLDAGPGSQEQFEGRDIHIIGAGEDKRIIAEGEEQTELVQTGSGSVPYFPRKMYLPSSNSAPGPIVGSAPNTSANPNNVQNNEEYTLVGLGIRTVSFLSIEVYVMGMYVRTQDVSAMQARFIHLINPEASTLVPAEKEQLKQRLLDPSSSVEIWEQLLREEGIKSAWRVVPSKNTDFAHLRDGWINGIKRATQEVTRVKSQNPATPVSAEYEDETFGLAVKSFKDLFTGGSRSPKGSVVLLLRDAAGSLEVLFNDPRKNQNMESIGKVTDPRIGRLIWMGYLAGKNVSSEPARKAVVDGCVGFAARPVGTIETMVQ